MSDIFDKIASNFIATLTKSNEKRAFFNLTNYILIL